MSELSDKLQAAADALEAARGRLVIEDNYGSKYQVSRVFVVGRNTDDPGVVVRIEAMTDE